MRLTKHFMLSEATRSETALKKGLANQPLPEHMPNIQKTAEGMERVRALFERPIEVTSWYRSPIVNRAVGGVPTSHHALGWAVDFRVNNVDGLLAAHIIAESDINFDQLIYYSKTGVVHISFHPDMRREVRTNNTLNAGAKLVRGLPSKDLVP